jgi:hypothetical protein
MEFLEPLSNYIGPWFWFLPVPLIIFSATPRMPFWYKSGRILFMWFIIAALIAFFIYIELTSEKEILCCLSEQYVHARKILILFWMGFLINVYIGWWEFLWRCVYRQWTWPPLKNLQYGLVSNLCILGSAVLTIPIIYILIVVAIIQLL